MLDENFGHNDGPVITVMRGSNLAAAYPMGLPSPGSPSSSSSAHNMTEEEGQIESRYSTGRSDQTSGKLSKGSSSSNAASNMSSTSSTTSAGLGVWDIFRERFSRTRRPHSVERSDQHHHADGGGNPQVDSGTSSSQSTNAEREAAAIAVLENVIDSYNARSSATNAKDAAIGSVINQVRPGRSHL